MKLPDIFTSEGKLLFFTLIAVVALLTAVFAMLLFVEQDKAVPGSVRVNVLDDNDVDGVSDEEDDYGEKVFAIDKQTQASKVVVFDIRLTNQFGSSKDVQMRVLDRSLSGEGNISAWQVRFLNLGGEEQNNYTVGGDASEDLKVEIRPPSGLGEEDVGKVATFIIGGNEKKTSDDWDEINMTYYYNENFTYNNVTLKVIVGKKNIKPVVEKGEGEESWIKTTVPNKYTYYKIKITNYGSDTDNFQLWGEFGGETRGAIGDGWFVKFDPTDYIENLKSLDSTEVSVGIKPPKNAERGTYLIYIKVQSELSSSTSTITLTAKVPKPELDVVEISASPSPALDNVDSIELRAKVKNTGSSVKGDIEVSFAVQYNENEGWIPVGIDVINGLESGESKSASVTFNLTIPETEKQQLKIIKFRVEVDENWQIPENNKNNNIEESELEIVMATSNESSFASGSAAFFISLTVVLTLMSTSFYLKFRKKREK